MKSTITTIDLLRHGECVDGPCYRGSLDIALSDIGWLQMRNNLKKMKPLWHRVISSPMIRCVEFASEVADQQQLPLITEPGFKEMNFGEWEGQSIEDVWNSQAHAVEAWFADPVGSPPPSGEAADVFSKRVIIAFTSLIEQYSGEHILLVSHGGVMRVLLAHCLALPLAELNRFDMPYACVSKIQVITDPEKNYYRLLSHNLFPENNSTQ